MSSTATSQNGNISRFSPGSLPGGNDNAEITSLIFRANLLKERGQWEEAVAVCTDAVRRAPNSASAYTLLGDIYFAQHKSDDALHWYRMSLDRNPLQANILQKHDLILSAKRAAATGNFSASVLTGEVTNPAPVGVVSDQTARFAPASAPVLTATIPASRERTTAERTLEWIDRVFPPGRSEGMTRLLLAVGAVVSLLILLTGSLLFFTLQKSDASDDTLYTAPTEIGLAKSVPMASRPVIASVTPATSSVTSLPPSPVSSLMDRMRVLNTNDLTITSAQADAATGLVQLEVSLASRPGESTGATRNRVLQASAKAAQSAFVVVPTAQRFSVRVLLQNGQKDGFPDAENAVLIFVGETSAVGLHTLSTTSPVPDYTLLCALFTNTWWSNVLNFATP